MEERFICICNRPGETQLCEWNEPHPDPNGGPDFCGVKRAYICDDCVVVHWAWRIEAKGKDE